MAKKSSLTVIELIIAVCLISIFIGVFAEYMITALRIGKERALRNELVNIRMSIEHYRVIRSNFPDSLEELMNHHFSFKDFNSIMTKQPTFKDSRVNEQGKLLDPFFNNYRYDKETGRVYSQTKGYQAW